MMAVDAKKRGFAISLDESSLIKRLRIFSYSLMISLRVI